MLEGQGEPALVLSASARLPSRLDLPSVREIASQGVQILIAYVGYLLRAEEADFPPRDVARPSPLSSGRRFPSLLRRGRRGRLLHLGRRGLELLDFYLCCFRFLFVHLSCLPTSLNRVPLQVNVFSPSILRLRVWLKEPAVPPDHSKGRSSGSTASWTGSSSGRGTAWARSRKRTVSAIISVRNRFWPSALSQERVRRRPST